MLLVGVVARTQGNKGEVAVNSTTDFPDERFAAGSNLWCRRADAVVEAVTIRSFRMHLGRPVLAFDGVAGIGEAERYAGAELRVPASAQRELPAHVYYIHQLVGCAVWTAAGEEVGEVAAVEGEGGVTRLVVRSRGGTDVLVPFVQPFCTVDLDRRRIEVAPPEGLLDLNGAWRE
jgi:16S rRNA processing protein RimM